MKINKIEIGMRVLIKNDISITARRYSASEEMYNMKGKLCEVTRVFPDKCRIRDPIKKSTWMFSIEDIEEVPTKPPPPPVTFDPKNIFTF